MVKILKTKEQILGEKQETQRQETIDHNIALKNFLNRIEINDAIIYKNLRLFAINITEKKSNYKLMTLTEALKSAILEVQETNTVSNLKFINKSKDAKILIIEGEIVKGGRQNRTVNVTMILDEESETIVPTSCVEQHRWSGGSTFNADVYLTPSLSKNLSASVSMSMASSRGSAMMYNSNQSSLWASADTFLCAASTHSDSNDVTKAYEANEEEINDYYNKLKPLFENCAGLAAVIGKKLVFSIADSAEFFMPQFEKLLKSYILEALTVCATVKLSIEEAAKHLNDLSSVKSELFDSPNKIGKLVKFNTDNITGTAFLFNNEIVHLSIIKELE